MKKHRILKIIGIIVVVLIVIILIGSMYLGKFTTSQFLYINEENDTSTNSVKQLELWGYDLDEFLSTWSRSYIPVTNSDDEIIPMVQFSPEIESKGNAILVHGQGGDHISMAPIAEMYLKNGYTVFAIDLRSAGMSALKEVTFGIKESEDLIYVVDFVNELNSDPIIVHGQSMGAATAALYGAKKHSHNNIDYLILDSSYSSMADMIEGVMLDMGMEKIVVNYSMFYSNVYMRIFKGFEFKDGDVFEAAKKIVTPTLVIQSAYDEIAPIEVGQAIYEYIPLSGYSKDYLLLSSKHVEGIIDFPEKYEEAVFKLIGY
ncbi:MAG: alpha/beta hydrolase [Tissierellia bacterium]|nr:alpha/beta hydrolase [Tissierellia bacterium]